MDLLGECLSDVQRSFRVVNRDLRYSVMFLTAFLFFKSIPDDLSLFEHRELNAVDGSSSGLSLLIMNKGIADTGMK